MHGSNVIPKHVATYCTVGYVCKVLICVNYESCCIIGDDFYFVMNIIYLIGLMQSNKFEKIKSCRGLAHFNSALTLALSFQLTVHVRVPCL